MNHGLKFIGILFLGGCLFLTGCPDKPAPNGKGDPSDAGQTKGGSSDEAAEAQPKPEADPADVKAAVALLANYTSSHAENSAGAVVAVDLTLGQVIDPDSNEGQEVKALFDAINKLVDLEKVSFSGPGVADFGVMRLTNLKKVKTAMFENTNIETPSLEVIAETMKDLTHLAANRCMKLDGDSLIVIADEMPQLKNLEIRSNAFKTFDIRVLADLPALEQLDIRQCTSVDGDVLKYMGDIPTLKVLRLRGTSFRDASFAHLEGHPGLNVLYLQDANVSDACLDFIREIPNLADLSLFRLPDISNEGLKKLEGSKLRRLFIRDNENIDNEGVAVVKTMPELARLTLYEMRSVTDEGLITAIEGNKKLVDLAIYDMAGITDRSIAALRTTTALKSLELRKTGQTDETLKLVARLPKLETLTIGDNARFTDTGLNYLSESRTIKNISIMDQTGISAKGISDFKEKFPNIKVEVGGTGQAD